MFSIDLKDACFQIPVHPESCPYLQFVVLGTVYQFWVLSFGLSTFHQSVCSGFGVGSSKGDSAPSLSG